VEPKYEKKIENLDELLNSDVINGDFPALHFAFSTLSYPEFVRFFESKEPKEDCSDMRKCIERMTTKSDVAIFNEPVLVTYIAKELGTVDVSKLFRSQDDPNFNIWIHVFKKAIPLLDIFSIPMSRYLEAGLLKRLWAELQHRACLRREDRFREATGGMFFAFSFSHLMLAFVVLTAGTLFSSMVFIAELILNSLYKSRTKIMFLF